MERGRHGAVCIAVAICACIPALVSAHGDLHEQIAALTKRIAQRPDNPELYLKRGELHRAHRAWNAALADYDRALRLDPALDAAIFCRGLLMLDTGRPGPARRELDRFLAVHPDQAMARLARARALVKLGGPLAVVGDYSRALALKPDPDWYVERALALEAAGPAHVRRRTTSSEYARIGSRPTRHIRIR